MLTNIDLFALRSFSACHWKDWEGIGGLSPACLPLPAPRGHVHVCSWLHTRALVAASAPRRRQEDAFTGHLTPPPAQAAQRPLPCTGRNGFL